MAAFGFVTGRQDHPGDQIRSIGGHAIAAEYARTPSEQQRGLSGRDGLAPDTALVFPFDPPQAPTFWMKDMRFAIDIVWVAGGQVVGIELSVPADDGVVRYAAPQLVDLVVELPAGWCAAHGISAGDTVE